MSLVLYVGNSNVIELQTLTNSATDAVDTGATVEVTLKTLAGVNVTGQSWPLALTHASAGTYRATMDSAAAIVANRKYVAHVDVTGSGSEVAHWEVPTTAEVRAS